MLLSMSSTLWGPFDYCDECIVSQGGLAVAVPGELKGMELAHSLFGRCVIQPQQ